MESHKSLFPLPVASIRLVHDAPILSERPVNSPEEAIRLIGNEISEMDRECMYVLNLKNDGTPINCHLVSLGGLNFSVACPREIFKTSILSNAGSIILMHNHPSGNVKPSKLDEEVTERIYRLGKMMEIPLLDHVIVGNRGGYFFSFEKEGILSRYGREDKTVAV